MAGGDSACSLALVDRCESEAWRDFIIAKGRNFVDSCTGGDPPRSSGIVTLSAEVLVIEGVLAEAATAVDGERKSAAAGLRWICSLDLLLAKAELLVRSAE